MALYICHVLHVVDFLGSRRMETAPTSIEVLLRPTQSQSDEPSDLRGSLSPTSVYRTPYSVYQYNDLIICEHDCGITETGYTYPS